MSDRPTDRPGFDQDAALNTAAAHLHQEFASTFGVETIQRFLTSSYEEFARTATVTNFLPLLAERFARQRLQALARVEGHTRDDRPVVLFLCTHNAGRSQMALGGVDISGEYPKPWTDEVVQAADVVITMGCGDACPIFPGKRYEEWALDDPAGLSVEEVRPIRDDIERRVLALLDKLGVRPAPQGAGRGA